MDKPVKHVLFVCIHNSGRSQMAEAFVKSLSNGSIEAESAGTVPGDRVNPTVVEAMREKGIDVSGNVPKLITQEMVDCVDKAITMGCTIDESCPAVFVPSADWDLDDPHGQPIEEVRTIRDEIEARVKELVAELG